MYTTLAWVCRDWLNSKHTVPYFLLKLILFPYLKRKCLTSKYQVNSLQSCYRVLARRRRSAGDLDECSAGFSMEPKRLAIDVTLHADSRLRSTT